MDLAAVAMIAQGVDPSVGLRQAFLPLAVGALDFAFGLGRGGHQLEVGSL